MLIGQSSSVTVPYLTFVKVHVVMRLGKARAAEGLMLSGLGPLALGTSTPFCMRSQASLIGPQLDHPIHWFRHWSHNVLGISPIQTAGNVQYVSEILTQF